MGRLCAVALLCLLLVGVACRETVVVVATPTPEPTAAPDPTPAPVPTPSLQETIQRLKQSVVNIGTNHDSGSGVIYAVEGSTAYIVTNEHVIAGASSVQVRVRDSVTYQATMLGWDAGRDLAVLSICCDTFQAVPFTENYEINTGIEVLVIGYPDGRVQGDATVTRGIISAIGTHEYYSYGNIIQTDAAMNPGNSGGPVFSLDGKVVGIATLGYDDREALGFAIPASTVVSHLPALRAGSFSGRKPTLTFSDLDWVGAQIQNAIARTILEWGYGYETDAVFGGTVPLQRALARGDTNVTMEIWLPHQQEWYDAAAAGTVTSIGKSLEDNWQSAFIIPQYVADAHPGLRTPEDLKRPEYRDLFVTPNSNGKAQLLNCIPGWECEGINQQKIRAYGLQDHVQLVNPESPTALTQEIRSAFQRREPVLFYYWGPTVLSQELETQYGGFKLLEEPEYTDTCWQTDKACQYSTSEIFIVVRSELLQSAPDAIEFLKRWDFQADNQLAVEGYLEDTGASYPDVALWFLRNTREWQDWVTPEARAKVLAALDG